MPNPAEPDRNDSSGSPTPDCDAETTEFTAADGSASEESSEQETDEHATEVIATGPEAPTEVFATKPGSEAPTEVFDTGALTGTTRPEPQNPQQPERRFTAPGFDANRTEVIHAVPEADTELFRGANPDPSKASPQQIPPRFARKLPTPSNRSWGWVLALIFIILALAAVAVLGTVWLTRGSRAGASQEDRVRSTLHDFDLAVQNGDLPALRGMTCGVVRDNYLNYDDQAWADTYRRIAAAKRYPVIADVDQIVVNGDHAEANVTAFMAYAPQVRSTRSVDLQFRDNQWKVCQSPGE